MVWLPKKLKGLFATTDTAENSHIQVPAEALKNSLAGILDPQGKPETNGEIAASLRLILQSAKIAMDIPNPHDTSRYDGTQSELLRIIDSIAGDVQSIPDDTTAINIDRDVMRKLCTRLHLFDTAADDLLKTSPQSAQPDNVVRPEQFDFVGKFAQAHPEYFENEANDEDFDWARILGNQDMSTEEKLGHARILKTFHANATQHLMPFMPSERHTTINDPSIQNSAAKPEDDWLI